MKAVAVPDLPNLPAEKAEFTANPMVHFLDAFSQHPWWSGANDGEAPAIQAREPHFWRMARARSDAPPNSSSAREAMSC